MDRQQQDEHKSARQKKLIFFRQSNQHTDHKLQNDRVQFFFGGCQQHKEK
jgi:hypothetical protein